MFDRVRARDVVQDALLGTSRQLPDEVWKRLLDELEACSLTLGGR